MKIKITEDVQLAHWNIKRGEVFEVLREEKEGSESNKGYWINTSHKGEVKILKHECRLIES